MKTLFTLETVWSALRLAIPVAIAALGAIIGERAGVLNLGLEGMMLTGAFGGFVIADATGNSWVGMVGGPLTGAACGALFALLVVTIRANQIVTGLAFTLLASSATTYLFDRNYEIGGARVDKIPQGVLIAILVVLVAAVWYYLNRTTSGLALSAVGESPVAADALGYRVQRVRWLATIATGAFAGLAGSMLVCGPLGLYTRNVTNGRGWVALALVVFARWRPVPCVLGALLFGLCDAAQFRLQNTSSGIPYEVFLALPYAVTLLALVVRARVSQPPSSLGTPFARGAS
jgi:simple sugar transport system permease protein